MLWLQADPTITLQVWSAGWRKLWQFVKPQPKRFAEKHIFNCTGSERQFHFKAEKHTKRRFGLAAHDPCHDAPNWPQFHI